MFPNWVWGESVHAIAAHFWVPCCRRDSWHPRSQHEDPVRSQRQNVAVRRARPWTHGVCKRRPPPHWPGQGTSGARPQGARARGARPPGAGPREREHPSAAKTKHFQGNGFVFAAEWQRSPRGRREGHGLRGQGRGRGSTPLQQNKPFSMTNASLSLQSGSDPQGAAANKTQKGAAKGRRNGRGTEPREAADRAEEPRRARPPRGSLGCSRTADQSSTGSSNIASSAENPSLCTRP